jgi:hypothetical protein
MSLRSNRRIGPGWMLAACVAVSLATTTIAGAGSLCFSNNLTAAKIVLVNAKLKKGKAAPLTGYARFSGAASPLSGESIVNASGNVFAFAFTTGRVSAFFNGGSVGATSEYKFALTQSDGNLDVGDFTGAGVIDGTGPATVTVIDCETVQPIP